MGPRARGASTISCSVVRERNDSSTLGVAAPAAVPIEPFTAWSGWLGGSFPSSSGGEVGSPILSCPAGARSAGAEQDNDTFPSSCSDGECLQGLGESEREGASVAGATESVSSSALVIVSGKVISRTGSISRLRGAVPASFIGGSSILSVAAALTRERRHTLGRVKGVCCRQPVSAFRCEASVLPCCSKIGSL